MIEVKNLVKNYGPVRAVDGVTFTVSPGEIVGFLGPNGAGKSTTMKVLTCFISADGGSATVQGHSVFEDTMAVRKAIGYLPENTPLYEDMGVIDFLHFICAIRSVPMSKRRDRIRDMVDVCGLKGVTGKMINQLSRGYRQRVGLAQAMIHDPQILVLDEPTSALDPSQIKEIRDLIIKIGKTKTILLSTHIMQEVTATCNRAIIIAKGRIAAEGSPADLTRMSSGLRTYQVEVRCNAAEWDGAVKGLAGFAEVDTKPHAADSGYLTSAVSFTPGQGSPGEELFALARDRGWMLRELREQRRTLEEVFIQLTQKS